MQFLCNFYAIPVQYPGHPTTILLPFRYPFGTVPPAVMMEFVWGSAAIKLQNMPIIWGIFLQKFRNPASTSCKADHNNRPLQGRIFENESCALDKVGWEATGWMITYQFPVRPD